MLTSTEHEIFPAQQIGILTFLSRKNCILGLSEPKKSQISWYFYTYEHLKFHAQLSWAWKKFYNLGPDCSKEQSDQGLHSWPRHFSPSVEGSRVATVKGKYLENEIFSSSGKVREFCGWPGKFRKVLQSQGIGKYMAVAGSLQKIYLFCSRGERMYFLMR